MKLVRGRADARWLPSRHNFAIFRLLAYLRLRRAQPEHTEVIYAVDRHQSTTEMWLVLSWLTVTMTSYLAVTLFSGLPAPLALAISLPASVALMQVPAIISALIVAPFARDRIHANGIVVMLLFTVSSAYFATRPTWVRFIAWQFLALLALNAVAAVIAFALRDSIARAEGGVTSAP